MNLIELEQSIRQWGVDRNITAEGGATVQAQASKGLEEMAEMFNTLSQISEIRAKANTAVLEEDGETLRECFNENNRLLQLLKDDIGDVVTCMIQAARLAGTDLTECLEKSWSDIEHRKGQMVAGKFVKEAE